MSFKSSRPSFTDYRNLHTIIQVLNNSLDQVFSTSQLVEMIERSENLKLLQQPVTSHLLTSNLQGVDNGDSLNTFLMFTQGS